MLLQYLQISMLNVADESFRITFAPHIERLKHSIRAVGIVQPIMVRHTVDGAYQVVAGYQRVLACQALGRQTVPALIYQHTDLSAMQAFLLNLHDNIATRSLNLIEQAGVCERLATQYGVSEEDLVQQYLPLLGFEASYKVLAQLRAIAQITVPMKQHIAAEGYPVAMAARIAEFSPSTQGALLEVIRPLRTTPHKLGELLTLIREIAARDGVTVEEILHRYQLLTVIADPNVAAPEKVTALRQTLKGVRMPIIMQRQAELASMIRSLELPQSAKVSADPYFEDQRIKLECQFRAPEELELVIDRIQQAFREQKWNRLFEWYRN
ncbi:MAG: ParB/RepB/Spo0J family partition protein [Deltaproteobacteria bacterium]|nr:ParB/RepB/Spo0J family partition protein [Deltaproteobacteria bacterium]